MAVIEEKKCLKRARSGGELKDEERLSKKIRSSFCVISFQKRLRKDCNAALEEFIQLSRGLKGEGNPAVKFLREGGQIMEVLNVLKGGHCQNPSQVSSVFDALRLLLLRVLTEVPEHKPNAEEMCHDLLTNHLNHIHNHLSMKSNARFKKVVLQLLTAIVTLNVALAKYVLSHVSLSNEILDNIVEVARPDDKQNVRTCFIQLLMSYLVEGNTSVIRFLLEKRKILTSIVPGLVYDPENLVVFVVTTLRTKLVEVMEIPKTQKLLTFNTRVMWGFLNLYRWKGPAAYVGKWKKNVQEPDMDFVVNKDQLHRVAKATHALILSLCTSPRYGVLFRDHSLGMSGTKQNSLVASVIKDLKQPWTHKLQSELVVKTVEACPDLAPVAYAKVAPVLEPRASPSWISAISFTTKIISSLVLKDLVTLKPDLALQAVKTLVCPEQILSLVSSAGMIHEHPAVRLKTIQYFQAVLRTVEFVRCTLEGQEAAEFDRHMAKLLPHGGILESACSKCLNTGTGITVSAEKPVHTPSPIEQMLALVDLMSLYQRHYPLLLDFEGKHESLASTLAKSLDLFHSINSSTLHLKVKVLQVLTQMDTSIINPGKAGFSGAISTLLDASCGSGALADEAQFALGSMLVKCGALETASADGTDELSVWIYCCEIAERAHRSEILSFLQDVLTTVATNPTSYIEQMLDTQQEINSDTHPKKNKFLVGRAEQVFEELLSTVQDEKLIPNSLIDNKYVLKSVQKEKFNLKNSNTCSISSLLICVLEVVASRESIETPLQKYLSYVLVHLLHMQVDPRSFICVTKRWESLPVAVAKYINSWLEEQPVALTDPFGHYTPECALSRLFLQPNRVVPELEDCSNPVNILLLARLVCFHIAQLAGRQQLTETITEGGSEVILSLFEALHHVHQNEDKLFLKKYIVKFFSAIFKHPVLISYFSPLHEKEHINEKLITNFLISVMKEMDKYKDTFENREVTGLLRDKLLRNIIHYLEKSNKVPSKSDKLLTAVQYLSLTNNEKHRLISNLKNHMLMKPWAELLVYLLQNVDMLPSHEMKALGNVFRNNLQQEDKDSNAIWIVGHALFKYFEKFPYSVLHLPNDLFQVVLCKEGMNLASIMLRHQESYRKSFIKHIEQDHSSVFLYPDVLLHLMEVLTHQESLPLTILRTVYSHFQEDILKAMQIPVSAPEVLGEHPLIIQLLIRNCLESDVCEELCDSLGVHYKSMGLCSPFHVAVIHGLQTKGGWREKPSALAQLLLHQLIQMLQQEVSVTNIIQLCTIFVQHMADDSNKWDDILQPNESWAEVPALFLRIALKESDADGQNLAQKLLTVLSYLLWTAKASKIAELVFEMTTSHSRFLDIVLVQERAGIKLAVVQLVLVCYQLAPQVMKSDHIPVWLGAYGASLSHCDQIILKILHCIHGNKEVNLNAYRPFLWGNAAINHYSIRSRAGMSLWRVPQATVALELLNLDVVHTTIARFPIHRKLFIEENSRQIKKPNNNWCLEILEPCQPEVYDPAFVLPLLNHLVAPESVVYDYKFSRLGGLALTLACLGSKCKFIRAAALSVISRFHSRLDMRSPFAKLHEQYLEVIRGGIKDMKDHRRRKTKHEEETHEEEMNSTEVNEPQNHKDGDNATEHMHISNEHIQWAPKLPNLSASFLARASLVIINPLQKLHGALNRFILAKPAINLNTVPELLELMRPSSLEYRSYQEWLLETVLIGMKTSRDVTIARNSRFFKMMFSLFSSSLSSLSTKTLILQILEATMKVKSGLSVLEKSGLIPWLYASFTQVNNGKNGKMTVVFIRVLVILNDHFPVPILKTLPLLLNLPHTVECCDLHHILRMVHYSVRHVSKEHLLIILRLCHMVLDQEVVETCARQLQILASDIARKVNLQEIRESTVKNETLMNTVDKNVLNDELSRIVVSWLSCNIQSTKTKRKKKKKSIAEEVKQV